MLQQGHYGVMTLKYKSVKHKNQNLYNTQHGLCFVNLELPKTIRTCIFFIFKKNSHIGCKSENSSLDCIKYPYMYPLWAPPRNLFNPLRAPPLVLLLHFIPEVQGHLILWKCIIYEICFNKFLCFNIFVLPNAIFITIRCNINPIAFSNYLLSFQGVELLNGINP